MMATKASGEKVQGPGEAAEAKTQERSDRAAVKTQSQSVVGFKTQERSEAAVARVGVSEKTPRPGGGLATIGCDAELLSMSEDDYMNAMQMAYFKQRLQAMERELLHNAGETTEHLRETVIVPDPADRATIEEEHALELRTRDRERKLLKKVQQAIGRIDSGEYGWCEETGEPIGLARLLARPTATLSLEAQQRRELRQKLYGDD
jgi:DnaK suppressor protein